MLDLQTVEQIKKQLEADYEYVVGLRRYFHSHPELSAQEFGTALKIEEELDKLGVSHQRVGETGVYCEIDGKEKGKCILLRADTDALAVEEKHECPYKSLNKGVMHACGHDGHTASLLGAAKYLATHRDFQGKVKICFQQGEEIGYGARLFVDGGFVDGAERTFGVHFASEVPVGKIVLMPGENNASVDWFRISVKGKAAHVSTPERGVDALYICAQIATSLQAIITRRLNPMQSALIGIGKMQAGTAYNVVAEEGFLEGTVRVFSPETRRFVKKQIEEVSRNIAEAYGGEVSFAWKDYTSPLVNDEEVTKEIGGRAKEWFGEENIITSRKPALGGDDFAEFIIRVKGTYAFVGSGNKEIPETCVAHHNDRFDLDERCLTIAETLYVLETLDFLS